MLHRPFLPFVFNRICEQIDIWQHLYSTCLWFFPLFWCFVILPQVHSCCSCPAKDSLLHSLQCGKAAAVFVPSSYVAQTRRIRVQHKTYQSTYEADYGICGIVPKVSRPGLPSLLVYPSSGRILGDFIDIFRRDRGRENCLLFNLAAQSLLLLLLL